MKNIQNIFYYIYIQKIGTQIYLLLFITIIQVNLIIFVWIYFSPGHFQFEEYILIMILALRVRIMVWQTLVNF